MPVNRRDRATIVVDLSEGDLIHAGYAGDKAPRAALPSRPSAGGPVIQRGVVVDWSGLTTALQRVFDKGLRVSPGEHPLLIVEPPVSPRVNRERLIELVFGKLRAPAATIVSAALAAVRQAGRASGVMLHVGERESVAAPVHRDKPIYKAITRLDVGARDLTEYLREQLAARYAAFQGEAGGGLARGALEQVAAVTADGLPPASEELEQNYELPDGQVITIGAERFRCPELLFQPSFLGVEQDGIHRLTFQSITKCDVDVRKDLYSNVVMSGGTTMYQGIPERVQKEIKALAPDSMTIKIIAPPERKYSVWLGGSILSSLSTFEEMWITRDEYDEAGPSIVHRKCS
ncbi:MAG: actin family protein [Myxococcales bacterium]|nr:actin family protein [Myxococcales bacterium]